MASDHKYLATGRFGRFRSFSGFLLLVGLAIVSLLMSHNQEVGTDTALVGRVSSERLLIKEFARYREPVMSIVTNPDVSLPRVRAEHYSPDGKWLVLCVTNPNLDSNSGALVALNLERFEVTMHRTDNVSTELIFSPDGSLLAVPLRRGTFSLIELPDKVRDLTLPTGDAVTSFALSKDQSMLAVAQSADRTSGVVTIFDLKTERELCTMSVPSRPVDQLEFSSDGKYLAALKDWSPSVKRETMQLSLFETRSGSLVSDVDTGWNAIFKLGFSEDGKHVYALQHGSLLSAGVPALDGVEKREFESKLLGGQWPQFSGSGYLLFASKRGLAVYNIARNETAFEIQDGLIGYFTDGGRKLEVLDEKRQSSVYDLAGNKLAAAPTHPDILRPKQTGFGMSWDSWCPVFSTRTGEAVAVLQILSIKDELAWVSWTSENHIAGSANWEDYAKVVWRGGGRRHENDRESVRKAFVNPELLTGKISYPKAYPVSQGLRAKEVQELLSEVLEEPGSWNQMCSGIPRIPQSVLPLYGFSRQWRGYYISEQQLEQLRDSRNLVINEICKRLRQRKMVFAQPERIENSSETSGWFGKSEKPPSEELENLILILLDLNAVEALPILLELESELYKQTDLESVGVIDEAETRSVRYSSHVQLLSLLTAILQNENVSFESSLSYELCEEPSFDPSEPKRKFRSYEYSKVTRDIIIEHVEQFIANTNPLDYVGPNAMTRNARRR